MAGIKAPRSVRFSRMPIIRSEIRALRDAANATAERVDTSSGEAQFGLVLTSNMLAGFCLELGLKLFPMTFAENVPRGHDLSELYKILPRQIKGDIAETYAANAVTSEIKLFAFKVAPDVPSKPSEQPHGSWDTAENLFEASARMFERARYFYEEIGDGEWAVMQHGAHYMIRMSHVLDTVYAEYLKRGGWA